MKKKKTKRRKNLKNPNLYMDMARRYAPYVPRPPIDDGYDEIVLRNLTKYMSRTNPDSKALHRAYVAAKQAALDGDTRAVVVLRELEKLLAEDGLERMRILRNKEARGLRKKNPKRRKRGGKPK